MIWLMGMASPLTLVCSLGVGLDWRPRGLPGMRSLWGDFAECQRTLEVRLLVP